MYVKTSSEIFYPVGSSGSGIHGESATEQGSPQTKGAPGPTWLRPNDSP